MIWEAAGYMASVLVITAFCMKDITSLRALAIVSNVAFLTYGLGLGLAPVWLLHAILLPLNCWRLGQTLLSEEGWRKGLSAVPERPQAGGVSCGSPGQHSPAFANFV